MQQPEICTGYTNYTKNMPMQMMSEQHRQYAQAMNKGHGTVMGAGWGKSAGAGPRICFHAIEGKCTYGKHCKMLHTFTRERWEYIRGVAPKFAPLTYECAVIKVRECEDAVRQRSTTIRANSINFNYAKGKGKGGVSANTTMSGSMSVEHQDAGDAGNIVDVDYEGSAEYDPNVMPPLLPDSRA